MAFVEHKRENKRTQPDILKLYHKHMHGTVEPFPSKKWVDLFEEQILTFFGKLFAAKGFDKPVKAMTKSFESCLSHAEKPVRESTIVLYSVASLVNMLPEQLLNEVLPLVADLIFMTKTDFSKAQTEDAQKIVLKFKKMITSPKYIAMQQPQVRMRRIVEAVDSIRKYSEFLISGSDTLHGGRSPREILRDLNFSRTSDCLISK